MNKYILEICCGSAPDAIIAAESGADRIELNSCLSVGGLTPSLGSLQFVKERTDIPVIAMVRPRGAGFCYSEEEYQCMKRDCEILLQNGADGIAFGFLNEQRDIACGRTKEFIELIHGYGAEAVFHRAYDCTRDLFFSARQLIEMNLDRVLTSGGRESALSGADKLRELQVSFGSSMEWLAGAGINADNIKKLIDDTGVRQVHASCRTRYSDPSTSSPYVSYRYLSDADMYEGVSEAKVRAMADELKQIHWQEEFKS